MQEIPIYRKPSRRIRLLLEQVERLGGFCAGGYARFLVARTNKSFSDVDIYAHCKACFNNIENMLQADSGVALLGRSINYGTQVINYEIRLLSGIRRHIQLIDKIFGDRSTIINNFDMTVCQAALNVRKGTVLVTDEFMRDEPANKIRFANVTHTVGFRIKKYIDKGYKIDETELITVFTLLKDDHDRFNFVQDIARAELLWTDFKKVVRYPKLMTFLRMKYMDDRDKNIKWYLTGH